MYAKASRMSRIARADSSTLWLIELPEFGHHFSKWPGPAGVDIGKSFLNGLHGFRQFGICSDAAELTKRLGGHDHVRFPVSFHAEHSVAVLHGIFEIDRELGSHNLIITPEFRAAPLKSPTSNDSVGSSRVGKVLAAHYT
jgi:hypothetical protein